MPADFTVAKPIFDFYVNNNPRHASTWVDHGQQWFVCPSAIMCRSTKAHDSPVTSYEKKPVSEKLKARKEAAYPENFLLNETYSLSEPFTEVFGLGKQVVSLQTGTVVPVNIEVSLRHYSLLCPGLAENWKAFGNHRLCFEKNRQSPMLAVDFMGGTLWVGYCHASKPEDIKIETAAGTIVPACWSDTKLCYTKIRKEKKMLEPEKFMNDILKSNLKSSSSDLKFDPEKTGKENDGTTGVTLTEALKTAPKKAEPKKEAVKSEPAKEEVKVETAKEEPVKEVQEAVKEEATEEPKKATRKKVDTTPVNDLTKIIENLSGAIPEKLSAETVQTALRQLRDLQLAASRRAANIALQYVKETEGAVSTLAAIKAAL